LKVGQAKAQLDLPRPCPLVRPLQEKLRPEHNVVADLDFLFAPPESLLPNQAEAKKITIIPDLRHRKCYPVT